MKNKILFSAFIALLCVNGCFQFSPYYPKLLSFRDPSFTSVSYSRVMILADIPDWQQGYRMEERIVELLAAEKVIAVSAIKFMPPTRIWTEAQRDQVIKANSIDAVLKISIAAEGKDSWQVPLETTTTHKKEKEISKKGDTVIVDKSVTATEGGYTKEVAWRKYDVKMIDAASGKVAWITSAFERNTFENSVANALLTDKMVK